MRSNERYGNSVLERGFRLLEAFGPQSSALGLAELARRANLPKATTFRLASQLVELGALERTGNAYRLGLKLFELGSTVSHQRRLRDMALPLMEDLYEATHEMVHLGVRDDLQVLYLEKIMGRQSATVPTQVGARRPLYCTALGKAILAYSDPSLVGAVIEAGMPRLTPYTITSAERLAEQLAAAKIEGVAYDREECHLGTTCVAAPLIGHSGQAVGARSVTGATCRFQPERVATAVRTAALAVSRGLDRSAWPG
jgi:DNA-binding IclR family transcriptional regulator